MLRQVCTFYPQRLVRDVLGWRKGSFLSKYTQLYGAFFVSALLHWSMAYAAMSSPLPYGCGEFRYFLLQAVAIMAEDHIILLGKKCGASENRTWRIIGRMWVLAWLGWSMQDWVNRLIENGMGIMQEDQYDTIGLKRWLPDTSRFITP